MNFEIRLGESRLGENVKEALFRISQESVNNIIEHSGAKKADFGLEIKDGNVVLGITDNGRGFNVDSVLKSRDNGFGIFGMRERAESLGGEFSVKSNEGKGTAVKVIVPLGG
jgi:two-component system sensor histidine kinase DegS